MASRGLVLTAPASGSGKTVLTLALLRALKRRGIAVAGAKSGPDYIDPQFHHAASGIASVNLDAWAMDAASLRARAANQAGDLLIVEGAMGTLDGAGADGRGSAADLAAHLNLPVVFVIDAARMAQSAVLPLAGLKALRPELPIAGVIFNRIGSPRHGAMVSRAADDIGVPVLGTLPRDTGLTLPERHLGLVQAMENDGLDALLEHAADLVDEHVDLDAICAAARPLPDAQRTTALPPLGQRIAVARDIAFSFAYPHMLADWRAAGAEVSFFSPLADEAPLPDADAIFLPGGYPELHAATIAGAAHFRRAIHDAAERSVPIYGECGGYMVLGSRLTDAEGVAHDMLGLLPVETSFAKRQLHLGYRILTPTENTPFTGALAAHEFHYASVTHSAEGGALFTAVDAFGEEIGPMGHVRGSVSGSFAHIIGPAPL